MPWRIPRRQWPYIDFIYAFHFAARAARAAVQGPNNIQGPPAPAAAQNNNVQAPPAAAAANPQPMDQDPDENNNNVDWTMESHATVEIKFWNHGWNAIF